MIRFPRTQICLHGKDLSKADVSVNIYAWITAQETGEPVELCCAIGDEFVDGIPYEDIVGMAKEFIDAMSKSGFWNDDAQIAMLGITKKYAETAQVKIWWEEVSNE